MQRGHRALLPASHGRRRVWDFPGYFSDPSRRRRNIFAYIDARDLGQLVHRCLVTDGLGFQIFNAANDDHSVNLTTAELLDRYYAGVPVRKELGEFETLYSNAKAKAMLGWREQHNWRRYIRDPRDEGAPGTKRQRHE